MRVIFCEFDGVLHPASATTRFVPVAPLKRMVQRAWLFRWAWVLDELMEQHQDVRIVTQSNWRFLAPDDELQSFLGPLARRFIGSTPRGATRWDGIRLVVEENHLCNYLILDSVPRAFPPCVAALINCDSEIGLHAYSIRQQIQQWLRN